MDAHKETDKLLAGLELALKKMYSKKFIELKREVKEAVAEMELSKDLTPIERYNMAQKHSKLNKIQDKFTKEISELNKKAVNILNNELINVYKTNYKSGLEDLSVLLAISIPNKYEKPITNNEANLHIEREQSPFNKLAIDEIKATTELRREVSRQFVNSIMQGENTNKLIKRLEKLTELKLSDLTRIARTQTTRIESLAKLESAEIGEKLGYTMIKEWVCVKDKKTRHSHQVANGQQVKVGEPFKVDGEELMYPGDANGSPENVINCRCYMRLGAKKEK